MGAANERERPKQIAYQRDFLGTCWNSPRKDEASRYTHSRWLGVSKQTMQLGTKHHCFIVRTYYVDEVEKRISARANAAAKVMNEVNNFSFATRQAFSALDGGVGGGAVGNNNECMMKLNNNCTNGWENAGSIALGLHGPGSPMLNNNNNNRAATNNADYAWSSFASQRQPQERQSPQNFYINNSNYNINNINNNYNIVATSSPLLRNQERTLLHNKNGVWSNEYVPLNNVNPDYSFNNNNKNNYSRRYNRYNSHEHINAQENNSFAHEPTFHTFSPSVASNAPDTVSHTNSVASGPSYQRTNHYGSNASHPYPHGKPQRRKSNDNLEHGKETIRRQTRHTALQERVTHNFHSYLAMNGLSVHHSVIFRAAPSRRHYGRISLVLDGVEADATLSSYLIFALSEESSLSSSLECPLLPRSIEVERCNSYKESTNHTDNLKCNSADHDTSRQASVVIEVPSLHASNKESDGNSITIENKLYGNNKKNTKNKSAVVVVEVLPTLHNNVLTTTTTANTTNNANGTCEKNCESSEKETINTNVISNGVCEEDNNNNNLVTEHPLMFNDALSLSSIKENSTTKNNNKGNNNNNNNNNNNSSNKNNNNVDNNNSYKEETRLLEMSKINKQKYETIKNCAATSSPAADPAPVITATTTNTKTKTINLSASLLELIGGSNFAISDRDDWSIDATTPPVIVGTISPLELMSLPLNAEICFGGWLYISLEDEQKRMLHAYQVFLENNEVPTVSATMAKVSSNTKKEDNTNAEGSPLCASESLQQQQQQQQQKRYKVELNNKLVEITERSNGVLSTNTITSTTATTNVNTGTSTTSVNGIPNSNNNNNKDDDISLANKNKTRRDDLEVMLTENVKKDHKSEKHASYSQHHHHKHHHHHHHSHKDEKNKPKEELLLLEEEELQHLQEQKQRNIKDKSKINVKNDEPVWMPNGYIIVALPMYECSLLPSTFHLESLGSKSISLNLANAQSRKAYGVGCITGVRYGGVVIIECWDRMTSRDVPWIAKLTSIRNASYRIPRIIGSSSFVAAAATFCESMNNNNNNNNNDNSIHSIRKRREESMVNGNANSYSKCRDDDNVRNSPSPFKQRNNEMQLRSAPSAYCVQKMKKYILHELANHGLRVIEAYTLMQRKNGSNPISLSVQTGEFVYSHERWLSRTDGVSRNLNYVFKGYTHSNNNNNNNNNGNGKGAQNNYVEQEEEQEKEEIWNDSIVSMSEDKPENVEVRGVFRQIGGVKCMDASKLRYGAEACYVGKSIHTWVRGLLQWPIKARPLCVYLQRYEGIAHALFQRSMQSSIMDINNLVNNNNNNNTFNKAPTAGGNSFNLNPGSFHSNTNFSPGSLRLNKPHSPLNNLELGWNTMKPSHTNVGGSVNVLQKLKANTVINQRQKKKEVLGGATSNDNITCNNNNSNSNNIFPQRTTVGGSFVNPDELALQASFDEVVLEEKEEFIKLNEMNELSKVEKELDSTESNLMQAQPGSPRSKDVQAATNNTATADNNNNNAANTAAVVAFKLHTGAAATALINLLNMFSTYYTGPLEPVIRPVLSPEVEKLLKTAYTRLTSPNNVINAINMNVPAHWLNISLVQVASPSFYKQPSNILIPISQSNVNNNNNNNNNNINDSNETSLHLTKELTFSPKYNIPQRTFITENAQNSSSSADVTNNVNKSIVDETSISHEPIMTLDTSHEPIDVTTTTTTTSGTINNNNISSNSSSNINSCINSNSTNHKEGNKRISKSQSQRPPPLLPSMPAATSTTSTTNSNVNIDSSKNVLLKCITGAIASPIYSALSLPTQSQLQQSHYNNNSNNNNNNSNNNIIHLVSPNVNTLSLQTSQLASPTHLKVLPGASAALLSEVDEALIVPVQRHGHTLDSTASSSIDEYVFHDTCPMTSTKGTQPGSPTHLYGSYAAPYDANNYAMNQNNLQSYKLNNTMTTNTSYDNNNNNSSSNNNKINELTVSNANGYIDGNSSYSSLLDGAKPLTDEKQSVLSHTNNKNEDGNKHQHENNNNNNNNSDESSSNSDYKMLSGKCANANSSTVIVEECTSNRDNTNKEETTATVVVKTGAEEADTTVIDANAVAPTQLPILPSPPPFLAQTQTQNVWTHALVCQDVGFVQVWEAADHEVRALKAELEEMEFLLSSARTTWLSLETEFYRIGSLFLPHTRVDHLNLVPLFIKTLRHFPEDVPIKELQADWLPMLISLVTLTHSEIFFLNTLDNYNDNNNNNIIVTNKNNTGVAYTSSQGESPLYEPSFLLSDIAKAAPLSYASTTNGISNNVNTVMTTKSSSSNITATMNKNNLEYDNNATSSCDSQSVHYNNYSSHSPTNALHPSNVNTISNKYMSLAHNVVSPFLSRGSYLHYIPKNQVKDAHIAREVYTSGYTAYTIERNAMSSSTPSYSSPIFLPITTTTTSTKNNNNNNNNNSIINIVTTNASNNTRVNHLHTICIATPPPKIFFTSTHCLEQQHELFAGGLAMRFTGGSLGVLAGFLCYYGDQLLRQFHDAMEAIRFQYATLQQQQQRQQQGEVMFNLPQTLRDVLSLEHNVFLRRILIWGAAQGPRRWEEHQSLITKTLAKNFKVHLTNNNTSTTTTNNNNNNSRSSSNNNNNNYYNEGNSEGNSFDEYNDCASTNATRHGLANNTNHISMMYPLTRCAREREVQVNQIALKLHEHKFWASCKRAVGIKTNMEIGLDDLMRAGVPFHNNEAYALFDAIAYYLSCYEQIEEEWAQWQGKAVAEPSLVDHFELYISSDYYHKQKRAQYTALSQNRSSNGKIKTTNHINSNNNNINTVNVFGNSEEEDEDDDDDDDENDEEEEDDVNNCDNEIRNNNSKTKKRKKKKSKHKTLLLMKHRHKHKKVRRHDVNGKPTGNHIRDAKRPMSSHDTETPYCGGEESPELWSVKESERLFNFLHDAFKRWKSRRADVTNIPLNSHNNNNNNNNNNNTKQGENRKGANNYNKRIAILML